MLDSYTRKPIRVQAYDPERPFMDVRSDQKAAITKLLTDNGIRYEASDYHISINREPPTVAIYMARGTDPARVQALLDAVP